MQTIKILHNPRCSKSRQTLELLKENGISPEVVEYLKQPLNAAQIREVMAALGIDEPRKMMRIKEADYKDNQLGAADVTSDDLIEAMVKYPKLIERPIVINQQQARIGRPPESVLDIV